jgi:hypothetical protein
MYYYRAHPTPLTNHPPNDPCFFHFAFALPLPGFQQYHGNCIARAIHHNSLSTISHALPYLGCAFQLDSNPQTARCSEIIFSRVWSTRMWSPGKARNQLYISLWFPVFAWNSPCSNSLTFQHLEDVREMRKRRATGKSPNQNHQRRAFRGYRTDL